MLLKKRAAVLLLALLASPLPALAQAPAPVPQPPAPPIAPATPAAPAMPAEKPTFLIVGTFHFRGSTADLMSNAMPDILSEKRQQQIEGVVDALARFRPTRIAVEARPGSRVQEQYRAWLEGEYELGTGEIDQVAFRLARKLGHAEIWPVDHKLDMDFDGLIQAATKYGQSSAFDHAMVLGKEYVGETQRRLDQEGLASALRYMNDPEELEEGHGAYLLMAQVGQGDDAKGAQVVADWYRRNLVIYSNLARLAQKPGERVLLLIGAGHAELLRDFIRESPNLRLEEVGGYLP